MWKPIEAETSPTTPTPEHARSLSGPVAMDSATRSAASVGDQAIISKGLVISGEITGTDSLLVDGKVDGSINLPGSRVTVGRNGAVTASISAREIVVQGKVRGNVTATDRVDIRAEGALTGDVTGARISIEDGAFFKGGIDIRKVESKVESKAESRPAAPAAAPPAPPDAPKEAPRLVRP